MSDSPAVSSEPVLDEPTTVTVLDDDTRERWAVEARDLLVTTAGTYQAVATTRELAAHVQSESGIATTKVARGWIGDVLRRVSRDCADRNEPNLASLCVNAQGGVGDDYAASLEAGGEDRPADPEQHAADVRLECYRHFGATLPAGGGFSSLTSQLTASRARARKVRMEAQQPDLCPVHHMALPPSGICDYCD